MAFFQLFCSQAREQSLTKYGKKKVALFAKDINEVIKY